MMTDSDDDVMTSLFKGTAAMPGQPAAQQNSTETRGCWMEQKLGSPTATKQKQQLWVGISSSSVVLWVKPHQRSGIWWFLFQLLWFRTHRHAHAHRQEHRHACTCLCTCIHACTHTHMSTHTRTHTHKRTHRHTHTHTHTHTHMHMMHKFRFVVK